VFGGVTNLTPHRRPKGFQVKTIFRNWFRKCKSRIERRLDPKQARPRSGPVFSAPNLHYEVSDKIHAITHGGIGAIHALVDRIGLAESIDEHLHVLKIHLPYHESDHVLNIAYNALCDGTCLQDIEQRRNDENFLKALDVRRIPDPTTAGDFCRRFGAADLDALIDAVNRTRLRVWKQQPDSFFDCATLDMDGSLVETTGQCKRGMDIAYDGTWGYHPLILSLAQTGEVLSIVNRPGNRPSHEGAPREIDRALLLFSQAGFRKILLRGDTDFSQTQRLDGWDANPTIRFLFGYDSMPNLQQIAEELPEPRWRTLVRPVGEPPPTQPRRRPANVKEETVRRRQFENLRLRSEDLAEFAYRPGACEQTYRMVVIRKNITKLKGALTLGDEVRYFFYLTNEREWTAEQIVFSANDRCNQENLLAQLHGGCRALSAPTDTLESNGAYMLMVSLAWNLKAWFGLMLPETGRWAPLHREQKHRVLVMEFKGFLAAFIRIPCQIVQGGRRRIYRLLGWNPHLPIFFRLLSVLNG
jgi:hypothetical protein